MKTLILILGLLIQDEPERYSCVECHIESEEEHKGSIHDSNRVSCESCHGTDEYDLKRRRNPHLRRPTFRGRFKDVTKFCGECHPNEAKFFSEGAHGKDLTWENPDTGKIERACLVCHDDHSTAPSFFPVIEKRCLECHPEGETHHGNVGVFGRSFAAIRNELNGVGTDLASFPDAPGLSAAEAKRAVERLRMNQSFLGQLQHNAKTTAFFEEAEKVKARAEGVRTGLADQVSAYSSRPLWLLPFVLIMAANLFLLRRYCRQSPEMEN